jgi:predicted RecA/RadA family phage recombinase
MFIQKGETIDYKNAGETDIAYNDVVALGTNRIGVAEEKIAAGLTGSLNVTGVHEFAAINTAAFSVGDPLYWDTTAKKLTNVSQDNVPAGWATEPKAQTGTTARVKIG